MDEWPQVLMDLVTRNWFVGVAAFAVPLTVWLVVRLVWWRLSIIARRARIQVKRISAAYSENHFLDLKADFIDRMQKNGTPVMSLATYVSSLDYGGNEDLAYRIATTLASSVAGGSLTPLLPLVPATMLPSNAVLKSSSILARFTAREFPSILSLAALVDVASQVMAQEKNPEESVPLPDDAADAMDLLARGEKYGIEPTLPRALVNQETVSISVSKPLRVLVEEQVDLGHKPDSKHYVFPVPFSPDILPGLCKGPGGLEHTTTPRMMCQNRTLCAIFNKLAANYMGWAGYSPRNTVVPYPEFGVHIEGVPNRILTCGDLVRALVEHGGGRLETYIRTNLTAFGYGLCVLDENAPIPPSTDPTDSTARSYYTQIPLAFAARTGVTNPADGSSVHQLSTHSGVEWRFFDNKLLGPECVTITFYTGIEGFTGFKPGGEWYRPWEQESHALRALSYEESIQAVDLAACESMCSNVCVRNWKFPFGGYGGLGVCADSVALIEYALRGRTTIFPLFMRGDAKSGLLYVIHQHIRVRLCNALDENKFSPGDPRRSIIEEFLNAMNRVARCLIRLPNDIQVEPHEVSDAVDRINSSTLNSPFLNDQQEKTRLPQVKEGWNSSLKDFETDFASFGPLYSLLTKKESSWRL